MCSPTVIITQKLQLEEMIWPKSLVLKIVVQI